MRENRTPGSVRGAPGNGRSYRDGIRKMRFIILFLSLAFIGCTTTKKTKTYSVALRDDHIEFVGFDHPALMANLSSDEWGINSKSGERYNKSKNKRCYLEAEKALNELQRIVKKADYQILINSLRPYHEGSTDCYVSKIGNEIIIRELLERRP